MDGQPKVRCAKLSFLSLFEENDPRIFDADQIKGINGPEGFRAYIGLVGDNQI